MSAKITPRQAEALQLRLSGLAYRAIGAQMGVTGTQAHRLVSDALNRVQVDDLESVRAIEVGRLDELLAAVWPRAMDGDDKAVARVLDIMERRSRLQGLDAPKVSHETHTLEMELKAPELDAAITAALEARGLGTADVIDASETPALELPSGSD